MMKANLITIQPASNLLNNIHLPKTINWRKVSGFVKDILCAINFWLWQTVLCMRMPLVNRRAVSGILYCNAKKIVSLKILEVTSTQAQPPEGEPGLSNLLEHLRGIRFT
jgi:hypothetical protein